eukprot:g2244.t1
MTAFNKCAEVASEAITASNLAASVPGLKASIQAVLAVKRLKNVAVNGISDRDTPEEASKKTAKVMATGIIDLVASSITKVVTKVSAVVQETFNIVNPIDRGCAACILTLKKPGFTKLIEAHLNPNDEGAYLKKHFKSDKGLLTNICGLEMNEEVYLGVESVHKKSIFSYVFSKTFMFKGYELQTSATSPARSAMESKNRREALARNMPLQLVSLELSRQILREQWGLQMAEVIWENPENCVGLRDAGDEGHCSDTSEAADKKISMSGAFGSALTLGASIDSVDTATSTTSSKSARTGEGG